MTKYNTLNVKLSNSQLNKLKCGIQNGTEVTLNLLSNLIGSSNDETNFPRKLLTDRQVLKILKAFAKGSSAKTKFSKVKLSMMMKKYSEEDIFLIWLIRLIWLDYCLKSIIK